MQARRGACSSLSICSSDPVDSTFVVEIKNLDT